jgi:sugar/nucleoside kinase (ribokinase family)
VQRLTERGVQGVVIHLGDKGAGYFSHGELTIEPPSLAETMIHSTGTGDVLSMCMILLHARADLSMSEKLRQSNRLVRDYIEGRRTMIPSL